MSPSLALRFIAALTLLCIAGCATQSPLSTTVEPAWPKEAAPSAIACPEGPPTGTRCLRGRDSAGAPYLIAMPTKWSGVLVVHAHGGPFLGAPTDARADEDIKRWSIIVREGHAYAASVFRQGGFAVTTAAEDAERVRRIFVDHVAKPKRTVLHGQSWGAMVAARAGELYPKSWDGILFTSGVVGGLATYDFRVDIRALYQHLCNNHPRPDEAQYPLSLGLPAGSKLTNADVTARVNECLALNKPAAERTPEQRQKAKTIADVIRIPENSIQSHINWGTFTLADITRRHGGAPIGNANVRYSGSSDDAALNAALDRASLRFAADPVARAKFVADVDHNGRFAVPVLTTHGVNDSTVFVEGSDTLRARMVAAGNGARLVQTFVDSREHSYLGDAIYPPLFEALLNWIEKGDKPTPASIAERCRARATAMSAPTTECRFMPEYTAKPMASRIPAR
jgi:pimeloyl-ACP methyl ester carboxylesterase